MKKLGILRTRDDQGVTPPAKNLSPFMLIVVTILSRRIAMQFMRVALFP